MISSCTSMFLVSSFQRWNVSLTLTLYLFFLCALKRVIYIFLPSSNSVELINYNCNHFLMFSELLYKHCTDSPTSVSGVTHTCIRSTSYLMLMWEPGPLIEKFKKVNEIIHKIRKIYLSPFLTRSMSFSNFLKIIFHGKK